MSAAGWTWVKRATDAELRAITAGRPQDRPADRVMAREELARREAERAELEVKDPVYGVNVGYGGAL